MKIKVLLTDGNLTNTLAAVRCLGKYKNIDVYITSESDKCLCSYSKFCKGTFKLPNPLNKKFIKELVELLKKRKFEVLIPIGYHSEKIIIKNKKKIEKLVSLPTVDYQKFLVADGKYKIIQFCKNLSINIPTTLEIKKTGDLKKIREYPVVIKDIAGWGNVRYAYNYEDLLSKYKEIKKITKTPVKVVQEYIPGNNGYGFYALYNKGNLVTYYIHKRLHMYPRTGGPATMACTYYNKEIYRQGKKILDALKWHGVAMVEFKQHERDGKFYLIEVNPKYWGSLDLGIAAGLDIPYYHVMIGLDKKIKLRKRTKLGVIFRWPSRDLLYALTGKNKLIEIMKWFSLFFNPKIKDNIWVNDFRPTIYQIKEGIRRYSERIKESRER